MKFRDPKTGEVFLRERAFRIYCDEKRGGNIDCPTCPICSKNNGTGESCKSFFKSHPAEAARLMGYEVLFDDKEIANRKAHWIDNADSYICSACGHEVDNPNKQTCGAGQCMYCGAYMETKEDNMNKQDKPRLAEVLGVEVGEIFSALGRNDLYISDDGRVRCDGGNLFMTEYLPDIINHPESIIRAPRLTEPEIAIMRATGAKWVSRNINNGVDCAVNCAAVYLWKEKPSSSIGLYFADGGPIATVNDPDLFPSVKPGDCIGMEDAE